MPDGHAWMLAMDEIAMFRPHCSRRALYADAIPATLGQHRG